MVDPNVRTLKMKAPGGAPFARPLDELMGDPLNVKNFGAMGNDAHDDQSAIQACFDTAFGGPNSIIPGDTVPHGMANAWRNKAVFFPPGKYIISDPLSLTNVFGGKIYGSGRWTTAIHCNDSVNPNCVNANGMSRCSISDMSFNTSSGAGGIAFDLDWTGSGDVGLSHNLFENVEFGFRAAGCRIAHSGIAGTGSAGREGRGTQFFHCSGGGLGDGSGIIWLIEGRDAHATHILGGNTNNMVDIAVKCVGGSVHVESLSCQTTATCDVWVSSGYPCSVTSLRTESLNNFVGVGPGNAFVSGIAHTGSTANAAWANSTAYLSPGTFPGPSLVYDATTYVAYKCLVDHTSSTFAVSPTFAAERSAHPTFWVQKEPIAVLANITNNFKLTMDAISSGHLNAGGLGGRLVGDASSTFYSRGGIFLRHGPSSGGAVNDFYTGFSGTATLGTYVI